MATGDQLASASRTVKYGETEAVRSGNVIGDGHSIIERLIAWPE